MNISFSIIDYFGDYTNIFWVLVKHRSIIDSLLPLFYVVLVNEFLFRMFCVEIWRTYVRLCISRLIEVSVHQEIRCDAFQRCVLCRSLMALHYISWCENRHPISLWTFSVRFITHTSVCIYILDEFILNSFLFSNEDVRLSNMMKLNFRSG